MGFTRLKSTCQWGCIPSGGSSGASVSYPFPAWEATCIPWCMPPSSIIKTSSIASSHLSLSPTMSASIFHFKGHCDYTEPNLINFFHACTLSRFSHVWLFCNHMDCSLPGSSVHGILQTTTLEWVSMPSSMGSSWPRDQTSISYLHWQVFFLFVFYH